MAKLILISETDQQEFELGPNNSIGRHPDNSIQILDRIISKNHAEIQRLPDGQYLLRDLKSLNGTFMRGEKVNERVLQDNDEISMGSTRLLFVDKDSEDDKRNRVTIAKGMTESHIRQRIKATSNEFLPESSITDEQVLRDDYERLRIGHELAKAVGSELDIEKLLPHILDKAFELVGADRGAILLKDINSGEMVAKHIKTRSGKGDNNIVMSTAVMSEVIQRKAAVLSSDATMDERFSGAHSIIMQGIRSTMTVPLLHADEILGVMHLDSLIATNAFGEKDLQICTGMAAQAAVAIQNARLASRIEQEAHTRAEFSRLIPPAVVEQVVKGELKLDRVGRSHEITMLFSDIRGFTRMSQDMPPVEVVAMLNEYFESMVEVLFDHSGTLDKFVGDEIIGLFGAPIPVEDAPLKAVTCALAMMKALDDLNRTRKADGQDPILIGIGINTGDVITGAIGSSKAVQYTAIGDAMNLASRLVNIAKPGEIILSSGTYRKVAHHVDVTGPDHVGLKGINDVQEIYRLIALKGTHEWGGPTHV